MSATWSHPRPLDVYPNEYIDHELPEALSDTDARCGSENVSHSPPGSSSRLRESISYGSLETASPHTTPSLSDARRHRSDAQPGRSCLKNRKKPHRKSVTFALDHRDLLVDTAPLRSQDDMHVVPSTKKEPTLKTEKKSNCSQELQNRAQEYHQQERTSLKRRYSNNEADDEVEAQEENGKQNTPYNDNTTDALLSASSSAQDGMDQMSTADKSGSAEVESILASSSAGYATSLVVSPIGFIGSQLEASNRIIQNSMQRAAAPTPSRPDEAQQQSSLGWGLSSSLVISAPVFLGFVLDAILG